MNNVEIKAFNLCKEVIEKLGFELVEVTYKKEYGTPTLTFFIYIKRGVTLDDCELVSTTIDPLLDEADISNGELYHLAVSSLGLDRIIKTNDDLRRNLNCDIELKLIQNLSKKKEVIHGILQSYDEEKIVIVDKNGKEKEYIRSNIEKMKPHIDFKRLLG
ncbi:MAG: ribosome maturation factor RimP [Clostridia bacterium]|nr:ribosome maturation factor RimP [Clostridia bacterium]